MIQIEVKDGVVTLRSTTGTEALRMIEFAMNFYREGSEAQSHTLVVPAAQEPKSQKHKKHMHTKVCPECGESFRGFTGLGVHRRFAHNVKSPRLRESETLNSFQGPYKSWEEASRERRRTAMKNSVKNSVVRNTMYPCTECGKSVKGKAALAMHHKMHRRSHQSIRDNNANYETNEPRRLPIIQA